MKKFTFILFIMTLSLAAFGQQKGKVYYLPVDTLKGEDIMYIELPTFTGYYSLSWELLFEEVGGTSDGIGILEASNDSNYVTLTNVEPVVIGTPNDTIYISDGHLQYYWLYGTPSIKYRIKLTGTVGDTTKITSNYVIK